MKKVGKSVKKQIVKACKGGNVIAADPAALKRFVNTVNMGEEPDWTIVSIDIFPHVVITWGTKSAGFGNITFYKKGKKLHCDSETLPKDFVKAVLLKLVDTAIFD